MSFKVTPAARNDILNIGRYTQNEWGKQQRQKYLAGLNIRFKFLAENPLLSRERVDLTPPVHIHRHEKHLIVYLVEPSHILIVRVLHESMDIETRLKEGDKLFSKPGNL